jgi:anti-sigma factor RsiW
MIDSKFTELMNLELDGKANTSQHAELERHLAENAEARSYFEELARVVRRLDSHPVQDPPAELHPRVVAALDDAARRRPLGHARRASGWAHWLATPRLRVATTFGLGIATGVVLLAAFQFGRSGAWDMARDVDPSRVSGTMVELPAGQEPAVAIPVSVEAGDVTGAIRVAHAGDLTRVDLSLDSEGPVEWVLSTEPGAWAVTRVERSGGSAGTLSILDGEIRGGHQGQGGVTVTLSPVHESTQPFVFKIVKSGRVVFERSAPPVTQ